MAVEKRKKKFDSIDDILLSPGTALIYMDEMRTQIYHMQKKLRKQRSQLVTLRIGEKVAAAGIDFVEDNYSLASPGMFDAMAKKMISESKGHMKDPKDIPVEIVASILKGDIV